MKLPMIFDHSRWLGRKNLRWILIGILILAGVGNAWYWLGGNGIFTTSSTVKTTPSYHTATARRGDLRISITGSGSLIAGKYVDLSFSTKGTLSELNVKLGDPVSQGETLARLGNQETLEANLAGAKLSYLEAKKELDDLQENAGVSLAQAYQDWVSAKAKAADALTQYQRTQYARCSQNVNTRNAAALERAKNRLSSITVGADGWIEAKNVLDTAQANYDYCIAYSEEEKVEAKAAFDLADVTSKQAESKYNRLKSAAGIDPDELQLAEAKVKEAESKLTQAQKDLEGVTLVAPLSGEVTYLAAEQGAIVGVEKFLTISDRSTPMLKIQIDESDLSMLSVGGRAEVVFDALPDQTFTGKVVRIDPQLSTGQQVSAAAAWVQLDEDSSTILQSYPLGLNATVEIIEKEVKDAVIVPAEAVHDLGDGQYAVFVESGGRLHLQVVDIGISDMSFVEIVKGINEGDVVSTGLVPTTSKS